MVLRNSGRVGSRRLEKGESRKREESVERLAPFFVIYTSRCRDVACRILSFRNVPDFG